VQSPPPCLARHDRSVFVYSNSITPQFIKNRLNSPNLPGLALLRQSEDISSLGQTIIHQIGNPDPSSDAVIFMNAEPNTGINHTRYQVHHDIGRAAHCTMHPHRIFDISFYNICHADRLIGFTLNFQSIIIRPIINPDSFGYANSPRIFIANVFYVPYKIHNINKNTRCSINSRTNIIIRGLKGETQCKDH